MDTGADRPVANTRFRETVQESFARQGLMKALGGRLRRIDPGVVEIELPYSDAVTQQHGYFHAAAVAAIADNAGGYAALTLMRSDEEIVAAEFKINFVRPAVGRLLVAEAEVVRLGRMLVVCQATVRAIDGDNAKTVAIMLQTNARVAAER